MRDILLGKHLLHKLISGSTVVIWERQVQKQASSDKRMLKTRALEERKKQQQRNNNNLSNGPPSHNQVWLAETNCEQDSWGFLSENTCKPLR